jgi:hypothetical protein
MFASFRISLLRPRRAPAEAHSRRVTDLKHGSSCSRNNVKSIVESSQIGLQDFRSQCFAGSVRRDLKRSRRSTMRGSFETHIPDELVQQPQQLAANCRSHGTRFPPQRLTRALEHLFSLLSPGYQRSGCIVLQLLQWRYYRQNAAISQYLRLRLDCNRLSVLITK